MSTQTKTATKSRTLPWGRWSEQIDREIARRTTPEQVEALIQAHLRGETTTPRTQAVRPVVAATDEVPAATDPMKRLIDNLLVERAYTALTNEQIESIKANKPQAHRFIDFLLGLPKVEQVQAPVLVQPKVEVPVEAPARARLNFAEILDGNYAVREDGVVKFYRVTTNGQWKNVQVRASDQLWPVKGRAGIAVLHRIVEAGLAASRMLFVTELGRCCKCGRSLTDEESRANALTNGGYGPDCANM